MTMLLISLSSSRWLMLTTMTKVGKVDLTPIETTHHMENLLHLYFTIVIEFSNGNFLRLSMLVDDETIDRLIRQLVN
ncbi:hypothetical protein DERF_009404 [Dermatophagoides farinae]|uniref:Uncharacterized protein n=1 Tax=Dermatophagoides farinae TaxID=6954 RepID=A0A922HUX0_DERFA|nr:hypothetical protein DERF_009404 [Dermatophagoides farinae]